MIVRDNRGFQAAVNLSYKSGMALTIEPSGRVVATDGHQLLLIDSCMEPIDQSLSLKVVDKPKSFKSSPKQLELVEGTTLQTAQFELVGGTWKHVPYVVFESPENAKPIPYEHLLPTAEYHPVPSSFIPLNATLVAPTMTVLSGKDPHVYGWTQVSTTLLKWNNPFYPHYYVALIGKPRK